MKRKAKDKDGSRKKAHTESTNELGNVERRYWLMKAEPESRMEKGKEVKFSIDDLCAQKTSPWDGVRSHAAKRHMEAMHVGDLGFFYHSNCKTPGIAGVLKVTREAYPDHTAWDPAHPYYDAKSDAQDPKWWMVDVGYVRHLPNFMPLKTLKANSNLLDMAMLKQSRLSVSPVRQSEWDLILSLAEEDQAS